MDGEALPHGKILNVQILRFIAAFAVLASHAADLTLARDSLFWSFPWTAGVDIFFVISGMIMTIVSDGHFGRPGAARHFLLRRIIRIVPIYWLMTALMIATLVFLPSQVRNTSADPASVFTSLLFIPWPRADGQIVPILAQGWTLNYEAFFYLAFAFAMLHRRGLALLVAGFAMLAFCNIAIPEHLVALRFWSDPIILEFVAGIGLAKLWLSGIRLRAAAVAVLAVIALALFAATAPLGLTQYDRFIANGVPAALLCAAVLFAPDRRAPGLIHRALVANGDASYALYLSHTFTINAVILLLSGQVPGWAAMGTAAALSIITALVIHRLIERPMVRALRARMTGNRIDN